MKYQKLLPLSAAVLGLSTSFYANADLGDKISKAVKDSKVDVNLRYRVESVDEDGKDEDALASTLKSRLTVTTGKFANFSAKVEVDDVTNIGDDAFNSTVNGKTDYPVVADPDGSEINQAFVQYSNKILTVSGGRQRIVLDDQRFVGGVAWRQNEQTFDGYRVQFSPFKRLKLDGSYVYNVNRIFGEDSANSDYHGDIYLLNAKFNFNKKHSITGYNYYLDFDNAATASSNTIGALYQGQVDIGGLGLMLKFAAATQEDEGDNPNNYEADYYLAQVAAKLGSFTVTLGQESLGSDNGVGFSTPLATLHAFQGFTDKFLNTPADGVVDTYIKASTKFAGFGLAAGYHILEADSGNDEYGDEINFTASYGINKHYSVLVKAAQYNADDLSTDTTKLWLMLSAAY
ncbi:MULTISPECIES: alginate export family protein [unclassified Thalassotalea]|uniref:alginate export family protein n=1 Tax=unclassified Thalassotalea TaxID=2614972 RepID=UPI00107FE816|nr:MULTISPECIES: alginate export family protein [unclassified Thalassotalea]NMP15047.1 alginate export family protein [Thalassotalea sp. Y01]QBY03619.1 hypothetical protein E2K93_04145 [Thalassotalea sp. HSM 43]